MITVKICKNHDGDITEFETRGHAGYDDSGKDIVCAAVSMLVINTINSIEAFTDTDMEVESRSDEDDALISAKVTGHMSDKTAVLLKALELCLTQAAKGNPKYISITFKEV